MRPMFDIRGNILNEFTASSDLYDIVWCIKVNLFPYES